MNHGGFLCFLCLSLPDPQLSYDYFGKYISEFYKEDSVSYLLIAVLLNFGPFSVSSKVGTVIPCDFLTQEQCLEIISINVSLKMYQKRKRLTQRS